MGFIQDLFNKAQPNPDANMKKYLLGHLTIKEVKEIVKNYISENPKFYYTDGHGIERKREPTRHEMELTIIDRVPLEIILTIHPKLKDLIDEDED